MRLSSIARAAGALALSAALLPAQAAPVQFDFSATVNTGLFAGEVATGTLRFDDAFGGTLASPGPGNGDLEIVLHLLGQTFDETNDQDFPGFPQVTLFEGQPVAIDFVLADGVSGVDFADPSIGTVALQGVLLPGAGGRLLAPIEIAAPQPQAVPEPASCALAGLALLGLAVSRRTTTRR